MLSYNSGPPSPFIAPWEAVPIGIVGYRLAITLPAKGLQYVLPGNSYSPDIMGGLGADRLTGGEFFPEGLSFPFPARDYKGDAHLDLHYGCTGAAPFQAFYLIFYVLRPGP